jgi:predicted phosphodiesterase
VSVGDRTLTVDGHDAPVAAVVDGLPVDTALDIVVDGQRAGSARTLPSPPGRELFRFATIGDIHMGEGHTFGVLPKLHDPGGPDDPPVPRCVGAALEELRAWGAQLVVVKGDLTHHAAHDEFQQAADMLVAAGVPAVATVGNHDVRGAYVDGRPVLAAAGVELAVEGVAVRDLPGLRLVVADATIPHRHPGSFRRIQHDLLTAIGSAPGPALIATHHQLQHMPFPTHWPPGVLGPETGRFLRAVREANPATFITSGHTHRHRARRHGPLLLTEVGSPKDYPGTWAGYVVHEGGIRQVVRRVAAPTAIRWTESTKRALFGIWGWWSPGQLDDRCLTHPWPNR